MSDPTRSDIFGTTIRQPGVLEPCPLAPEGATPFERQRIDRAWRNMHLHARDVLSHVSSTLAHPRQATMGNDAQALAKMHEQAARLDAMIEAVELRLAIEAGSGPT